jgi:hypothetical protein
MSTANRVTAKMIVTAAIALAAGIALAAPAAADPSAIGIDPNPFGTLGCNCRATPPVRGPESTQEINRGLREGFTVSVPGLPAPSRS